MAFVNEYVSEDDVKKYGLEEINKRCLKVTSGYNWTVDRERNIYLREIEPGREEFCDQEDFHLYWQGHLLEVRLKARGDGERGGKGWTHWSLIYILLPEDLEEKRSEILVDLKDALSVYKSFGIYTTFTEHTATFDF